MTDPLSVTASVIAVAGFALSSSKLLYDTLCGIRDAPETFSTFKDEVGALQHIILSFQQGLEQQNDDVGLSDAQNLSLRELKPALEACSDCCEKFNRKIGKLMSHSTDGHVSLRDKIRLQFQDKEIAGVQALLASYRSTLTIALDFSIQ